MQQPSANLPAHCPTNEYGNGSQVDQSVARKAQQEPEGEMEETETAAAAEALGYRSRPAVQAPRQRAAFRLLHRQLLRRFY
jgi:hypothetical protein